MLRFFKRSGFHWVVPAVALGWAALGGCRGDRGAEAVGDLAFELLQTVPQQTMNDYFSAFIRVEDIQRLARDTSLVKDRMTRARMARLTEEEWTAVLMQDRTAVLERGAVAGVRWELMAFDGFAYELKEVEGISGLDGQLLFSSEGRPFSVHVQAPWDGETYRLSTIDELRALGD